MPVSYTLLFLPTPSARRATEQTAKLVRITDISTHALREEGDNFMYDCCLLPQYFYPRPPRGGRRCATDAGQVLQNISTHALREEGDLPLWMRSRHTVTFLPTPSARRATDKPSYIPTGIGFLPTPSARRATGRVLGCPFGLLHISTHALREEGDGQRQHNGGQGTDFYPRPPRGGRPHRDGADRQDQSDFYPRPPRGGRPCRSA